VLAVKDATRVLLQLMSAGRLRIPTGAQAGNDVGDVLFFVEQRYRPPTTEEQGIRDPNIRDPGILPLPNLLGSRTVIEINPNAIYWLQEVLLKILMQNSWTQDGEFGEPELGPLDREDHFSFTDSLGYRIFEALANATDF
jgi:hypothetical protein